MTSLCRPRNADALLRSLGGTSMLLRLPAPAVPADVNEQLGLATPLFQDLPLAPVVTRKNRSTTDPAMWELLISAQSVEKLLGSLEYDAAGVLFANAYGVLAGDTLLEIISATPVPLLGEPYLYRLVVRAPQNPTT